MPTEAQLQRALRNAHKAGDEYAARKLANALKSGKFDDVQAVNEPENKIESASSLPEIGQAPELNSLSVPAFKASLGLLTTGDDKSLRGIFSQQFGDDVAFDQDEEGNTVVTLPSGKYALNKPGLSPQDVGRFAFDMLSFTPAGRAASVPAAIAKNATTEAVIEGAETSVGGDFSAGDVALAGGLGGGVKKAEDVSGGIYRAIQGSPKNATVEAGKNTGIPIFTSDVRPPKTFAGRHLRDTAEKIPFVGMGGPREAQQAMRQRAVDEFIDQYPVPSYEQIITSLKTQRDRVKSAAGSVLQDTGEKLDAVGEIPLTSTMKAVQGARETLSRPGVMGGDDAIRELDNLTQAMGEAPQTFSMLKENRTAFRDLVKRADTAERSQLTSRAKSLLQRVEQAMRRDMDRWAEKHLSPKEYRNWQRANQVYAEEATKLTKSRLKNVLDKGDITPEAISTMLFSRKPSEVRTVYRSLNTEGKRHARAAIVDKVVTDLSRRQRGLTPNSFASEMKKYGLQIDEFFKGEDRRAVNGLLKALDATRRAQDAAVTTPTGQTALGGIAGLSMYLNPQATIGTAGTVSGLARLYESAPVRNALLKLDSIPRQSTRFEKALAELRAAALPIGQATMSEASDQTQESDKRPETTQ